MKWWSPIRGVAWEGDIAAEIPAILLAPRRDQNYSEHGWSVCTSATDLLKVEVDQSTVDIPALKFH